MPRIQTAPRKRRAAEKPLEVRILRNICHIETPDRVRLWCRVALITPPENEPISIPGMIRGYSADPREVQENFTIYYGRDHNVKFNVMLERPQQITGPQLVVGQDIYSVCSDKYHFHPKPWDNAFLETKKFPDAEKMWEYIAEEIRK